MTPLAALVALAAGVVLEVPAGAPLAPALAAARPGDVVRLGPGHHTGVLGSAAGIRIEGAGAGVTLVEPPAGEDGAVARGPLELAGLGVRAGPGRCGLKVYGGDVRLDDVALSGGSCGAFVDRGRLAARRVGLRGDFGLLVASGEVLLDEGAARGATAGIALQAGTATVRRFAVTGPAADAGVTVARGTVRLEAVVVRTPGPTGLSVHHGGHLEGVDVTVAGTREVNGLLGACVQVIRGALRLTGATLVRCAGTAVEASGGEVTLDAVDAAGGSAGCLVLTNGARASLAGNLCAGGAPGLVVASGARASLVANRWLAEPALQVECASGARVELGRGEAARPVCDTGP